MNFSTITPCLWFDDQGEQAAEFYTSIFRNSRIVGVTHYSEPGPGEPGRVMTVTFELDGHTFVALNGGPQFTFSEAISFQVPAETQLELDHYWDKLTDGGEEGPCGWLKDKFGLSWQIVPAVLPELLDDRDRAKADRVAKVVMQTMGKLDIAALQAAAAD